MSKDGVEAEQVKLQDMPLHCILVMQLWHLGKQERLLKGHCVQQGLTSCQSHHLQSPGKTA